MLNAISHLPPSSYLHTFLKKLGQSQISQVLIASSLAGAQVALQTVQVSSPGFDKFPAFLAGAGGVRFLEGTSLLP